MSGDNGHIAQRAVDEELLDSAIDAVAREMTEGEPSGALRARVLEHIERGRRRPAPAVPPWAWASVAAAVTLAVATAVWIARPMPGPGTAQSTVAGRQPGAAPPAAGAERAPSQPAGVAADVTSASNAHGAVIQKSRAAAAREAQTAEAGVLQDRHPVPPLAEIEPLTFQAVEPDPLQIAAVEVAAFPAMSSIVIPSLGPGPNDIQSADLKKEKRP